MGVLRELLVALVHFISAFRILSNLLPLFNQKTLHACRETARELNVEAEVANTDVNLLQEAIVIASRTPEFENNVVRAVGHYYGIMTPVQRDVFGFNRWYLDRINGVALPVRLAPDRIFERGDDDHPISLDEDEPAEMPGLEDAHGNITYVDDEVEYERE